MKELTERFSLGDCIGRGGVGEVYRGWQVALDRPVAIKILRPELTRNRSATLRFEREARTTSLLNHPNVVTVIDVGTTADGRRFVVMELLEGETLADLLERTRGPLPLDDALHIAQQIVRGMAAGQGVGLVHRDLKPENIFLVDGNHVKILDFGLATLHDAERDARGEVAPTSQGPAPAGLRLVVGDGAAEDPVGDSEATTPREESDGSATGGSSTRSPRLTRPGTMMGTPRYMSPEQVLGWSVDHRSDLYSFGCILYEMLTGTTPFEGPGTRDFMRQHLHHPPPPVREVSAEVPRPVAHIVERLLRKAPAERYADWTALSEALRQVRTPTGPVAAVAAPAPLAEEQPTEPFRFLHPFSAASRSIFFGREADANRFREAWEHPDRTPVIVLTGASGVGKTSFLEARVMPQLRDTGHEVVRVRGTARPMDQLGAIVARRLARISDGGGERPLAEQLDLLCALEGRPIVVVIDQAEEVLTSGRPADASALQAGLAGLTAGGDGRVRVVLSLREDFLGALLRTLHPLPVDQLVRTLPLRPLEAEDLRHALMGPGQDGLAVRYAPYSFEAGLVDEIVEDLLADGAGEVAPRVQAVGARLWEMVKDDPDARAADGRSLVVKRRHYRERLGGARGILARILDEAIAGLDPADRGVAKELIRALTHLPGSPTSRPAPASELLAHAADQARREAVLARLESRWRIVHGYADPRWPEERTYRIAHEALIDRIQQYGEESSDRNRARQIFHQGLTLWLRGGRRPEDLLPERHFDEVQGCIEDLVFRGPEAQAFYEANLRAHNEGWMRRLLERRRRAFARRLQLTLVPTVLVVVGFVLGQVPVDFITFRVAHVRLLSALSVTKADLAGAALRGARLKDARLRAADLSGADLRGADLTGADLTQAVLVGTWLDQARLDGAILRGATLRTGHLEGATFRGADLRAALVQGRLERADFATAVFDGMSQWPEGGPPPGALGPRGQAPGVDAVGVDLEEIDLFRLVATSADFSRARLGGSSLQQALLSDARLTGADLTGTVLAEADLERSDLSGAVLRSADLRRARLAGSSLRDADLTGADLTGAVVDSADLCGAVLNGASLAGASWTGATDCATTRWPPSGRPPGMEARAPEDTD